MNTTTLTDRHVSIAPLRQALRSLARTLTRRDMAVRWAIAGGRTENSARRYIERVFGDELTSIPIGKADELCMYVLRLHPINVFGDEW